MPADLATLLAQRNARFRAWRTYGVPIAPGEVLVYRNYDGTRLLLDAELSCTACNLPSAGHRDLRGAPREELAAADRAAVEELVMDNGCSHLAPLLGEDPPEVVELTKLELLAGDPPR
jgi:hypothetical protein